MPTSFTLRNQTPEGLPLEATFDPQHGMNMLSFLWGKIQIICQETRPLFEERCAGLGALIGPHFHHRPQHEPEPFSHGIARYVPWKCEHDAATFHATLSSKEIHQGKTLAEIEEQNFNMTFQGELTPHHLQLDLSITSETDSLVGFHYYYAIPNERATVSSRTQEEPNLHLTLDKDYDIGYHPAPDPLRGTVDLQTDTHHLQLSYSCPNGQNSWQLWHPKGKPFVCIEPLSAKEPRKPHLTVSSLSLQIALV